MQQDFIQVSAPPDFIMRHGRIAVFHRAQIKLIFEVGGDSSIVPVTERSFAKLAKKIRTVVIANLRGRQEITAGVKNDAGDFIFGDYFPNIHVTYCLPSNLRTVDERLLRGNFQDIFK